MGRPIIAKCPFCGSESPGIEMRWEENYSLIKKCSYTIEWDVEQVPPNGKWVVTAEYEDPEGAGLLADGYAYESIENYESWDTLHFVVDCCGRSGKLQEVITVQDDLEDLLGKMAEVLRARG